MSHAFHDAREKYVQSRALRTEQWQDEVRKAWTAGAVTVMTHEPPPKRVKYRGTSKFLRRLAFEGGRIVCTNKLTPEQVIEARESQRLFVLADGVGFVIFPERNEAPAAKADLLHAQIMNLQVGKPGWAGNDLLLYKEGHRDARHAAAELVCVALSGAAGVPQPTKRELEELIDAHAQWLTDDNVTGERYIGLYRAFKARLHTGVPQEPSASGVKTCDEPQGENRG